MTFSGMTPDQIDAEASRLRAQAGELRSVRSRVVGLVEEASRNWDGGDLRSFRASWYNSYQGRVTAAADHLDSMASQLGQQAAQQRAASEAAGTSGKAVPFGPMGQPGPVGSPPVGGPTEHIGPYDPNQPMADPQDDGFGDYDKAGIDSGMGMSEKKPTSDNPFDSDSYAHSWTTGPIGDGTGYRHHGMENTYGDGDSEDPTWSGWHDKPSEDESQRKGTSGPPVGAKMDLGTLGSGERTLGAEGSKEGSWTSQDGKAHADGSMSGWAGLHAEGSAGVYVEDGALTIGASGMVGAGAHGEVAGSAGYGVLEAQGKAEATAGAWASADASLAIGADGAKLSAGVEAMAGASASAHASGGVEGAQLGVGVTAYAGAGIKANADISASADGIKVSVDFGVALGVGAGIKFDIDIKPKELWSTIQSLWSW